MQIPSDFNGCDSAPTKVNGTYNLNYDENNDVPHVFCPFFPGISCINLGGWGRGRKAEHPFFGDFNEIRLG